MSFSGAFPAAQSAIAKGDPSNWQIKKTTFQAPKSCFSIFTSRHCWEQAVSFSGAFPAAQSAIAKGDPPNWQIKKTTFQAPKSCFLIFTSRQCWEQAVSFSGAFPAAQSAIAMGDPPNWQIKKTTFQAPKSCFLIFTSRQCWEQAVSFSGAFPAAQSTIAMGDPPNWQIKKTTFQAPKSCFLIFTSRHSWEQAVSFSGAFPAAQAQLQWEFTIKLLERASLDRSHQPLPKRWHCSPNNSENSKWCWPQASKLQAQTGKAGTCASLVQLFKWIRCSRSGRNGFHNHTGWDVTTKAKQDFKRSRVLQGTRWLIWNPI